MSTSDDFMTGWTQGWMAATQALMQAFQAAARDAAGDTGTRREADFLQLAGNKPSIAGQHSVGQSGFGTSSGEPVRRRRGRPRKNKAGQSQIGRE